MAIGNELLQGFIAAAIVALVVTMCCLFYWCKIRKEKLKRNAQLEHIQIQIQTDTNDSRLHPKRTQSNEDNRIAQERKLHLQQILQEHQQWEAHLPSQPQLGQYKTLDLHHYTLKEAMEVFQLFLTVSLDDYYVTDLVQDRFIDVITGRGKHSKDGVPVIKLTVGDYLVKHAYTHNWPNPGKVRIDLFSKMEMSNTRAAQTSEQKSWKQYMGCNVV